MSPYDQDVYRAIQEAVLAERERCAKIADAWSVAWNNGEPQLIDAGADIAAKIRSKA